jgi:hypothetical protein
MADGPSNVRNALPDPWSRTLSGGGYQSAGVRRRSRPDPVTVAASVWGWVEALLSAALFVAGAILAVMADSASNRTSNDLAGLGVVMGLLVAAVGLALAATFAIAATGLWRYRSFGAALMIVPNCVGLAIGLVNVTKSPAALAAIGVCGIGALAGWLVMARGAPSRS